MCNPGSRRGYPREPGHPATPPQPAASLRADPRSPPSAPLPQPRRRRCVPPPGQAPPGGGTEGPPPPPASSPGLTIFQEGAEGERQQHGAGGGARHGRGSRSRGAGMAGESWRLRALGFFSPSRRPPPPAPGSPAAPPCAALAGAAAMPVEPAGAWQVLYSPAAAASRPRSAPPRGAAAGGNKRGAGTRGGGWVAAPRGQTDRQTDGPTDRPTSPPPAASPAAPRAARNTRGPFHLPARRGPGERGVGVGTVRGKSCRGVAERRRGVGRPCVGLQGARYSAGVWVWVCVCSIPWRSRVGAAAAAAAAPQPGGG